MNPSNKLHSRLPLGARHNNNNENSDEVHSASTKKPQRFSSPATTKRSASERDPSPAVARTGKRSASPVPSKCLFPSLAVAKEENRRNSHSKEPTIVVPSGYREPSPTGRRLASPAGRRTSMSHGRKLSIGMKSSPCIGVASGSVGSKKMANIVAEISRVSEALVGSAKASRKSWDDHSQEITSSVEQKERHVSKNKPDMQSLIRTQLIDSLFEYLAEVVMSEDESISDDKTITACYVTNLGPGKKSQAASKIKVHDKKWIDGNFGKGATQRKNLASKAAAEALLEAVATESVLRSLSMFSDSCSSSKAGNSLPTIDSFFAVYNDVLAVESLVTGHGCDVNPQGDQLELAHLWVDAALSTDLQIVSLKPA